MPNLPKDQLKPSTHTPKSIGAVKAPGNKPGLESAQAQVGHLHPVSANNTQFQHSPRKSGTTFKGKPGAK